MLSRIARTGCCAGLLLALALAGPGAGAAPAPVPPCPDGRDAAEPGYGPLNGPPAIGVWRDAELAISQDCLAGFRGRMALIVALAGRFEHSGTLEDLAARIGAVSATAGMLYWSTTDGGWRTLISEAYAVEGDAAPRPDFTAEEVLSGRPLRLAQDDTRSTGLNFYRLTARREEGDRLAVEIVNLSEIRILIAPLFAPGTLLSAHFLRRIEGNVWGYYGLSAVRAGAFGVQEKSFVNRAAAYHRFLTGVPGDRDPPLAP